MRQVKHPILVTELTYIACSSDLYKRLLRQSPILYLKC